MISVSKPIKTLINPPHAKPWIVIEGLGALGSVAIVLGDDKLCIESAQVAKESKYSSTILPLIKKLLSRFSLTILDIKGLILINGPGSFTGLRITNGLVHGLAHGLNCPVVSVSAFEIYAFAWHQNLSKKKINEKDFFLIDVIIDARLEEYFLARVQCKKSKITKTSVNTLVTNSKNFFQQNWSFSIVEEPFIFDNSSLKRRNLNSKVEILRCPNIDDFNFNNCNEYNFFPKQQKIFLSGWAALFCVYKNNLEWKRAQDIQPLYVRDRVAQTVLERKKTPALFLESIKVQDIDTVSSIEQDSYKFGWSRKNFQDSLKSKYICKKLINNSLLVGYFVWMQVEKECHILNFTIANGRQNRGLGQWMLSRLLNSLGDYKLESVFLEVRPSNKSAINLYGKNGFEIVGRRKNYYSTFSGREDALVMKRMILKHDCSVA